MKHILQKKWYFFGGAILLLLLCVWGGMVGLYAYLGSQIIASRASCHEVCVTDFTQGDTFLLPWYTAPWHIGYDIPRLIRLRDRLVRVEHDTHERFDSSIADRRRIFADFLTFASSHVVSDEFSRETVQTLLHNIPSFSATLRVKKTFLSDSGDFSHQLAQYQELVQKRIVLQDIKSYQNKIQWYRDIYRISATSLPPDFTTLQQSFDASFDKNSLDTLPFGKLDEQLNALILSSIAFFETGEAIRKKRDEQKIKWVTQEAKKWEHTLLPKNPMPELYSLIFVNLRDQKLYAYEGGELILSTPITSGRRDYETVQGLFAVYTKQRNRLLKSPFPDQDYELWVDYWLGFHGAYGLHDACNAKDCWRTRFGVSNYLSTGSHGCVNTPYNAVQFLYNWAKVGTKVYIAYR